MMLVAARAVHFGAVLLLFGGFVFRLLVLRPAARDAGVANRGVLRVAAAGLVVALASAAVWLGLAAGEMSGLPWRQAWRRDMLGAVLDETWFGQVWKVRFAIALALGLVIAWTARQGGRTRPGALALCALLAGLLLATLALVGHAAAAAGAWTPLGAAADAIHLLAAGAWLGALPPFVFMLVRSRRAELQRSIVVDATRRLSALGMVSVTCLVVTGLFSSTYLVGGIGELLGTSYGKLLTVKLGLFALMLVLAAANRHWWAPILEAADAAAGVDARSALRRLERNTIAETVLGLAIVGVVGALGTVSPGAHEQPVWPFAFALGWPDLADLGRLQLAAGVAAIGASALAVFVAKRVVGGAAAGAIGVGVALLVALWLCAEPAYPTTYFRSPIRYTASSIARGSALYRQYCTECHGDHGYGDGRAASGLTIKPMPLTKALFDRREGDLFWWLGNGMAGTAMRGFSSSIAESGRWDLVNFLLAQAEAEAAKTMNGSVEPFLGAVAPDFTFEMQSGVQETLNEQRGRNHVLLILFTYPESMPRLCILAGASDRLTRAGVRVIAVAMNREALNAARNREDERCLRPLVAAGPDPDIVTAYTLFRRIPPRVVPPVAKHSEFLIDRQGYLRARWVAQDDYAWDGVNDLLRQLAAMDRQAPAAAAPQRPPAQQSDAHWH